MTQRLSAMQQSPELFKKFVAFSMSLDKTSIEKSICNLVAIRTAQLNNCGFCLDMHIKQAKIHGERELRIHHIGIWRESTLFAPRERACLAWTDALTRLSDGGVPDAVYEKVRTQLSEQEISDLSFVVAANNGWNRVNIGFQTTPGSADAAFGLDKAGLN